MVDIATVDRGFGAGVVLEDINVDREYRPRPGALSPELIHEALAAFARFTAQSPQPRPGAHAPAALIADPDPAPADLHAAVTAIVDQVIALRYREMTGRASPNGISPEDIMGVLAEARPPWRLYDAPDAATYLWQEAAGGYEAEILLTDADHQDLAIYVAIGRQWSETGQVTFEDIRLA